MLERLKNNRIAGFRLTSGRHSAEKSLVHNERLHVYLSSCMIALYQRWLQSLMAFAADHACYLIDYLENKVSNTTTYPSLTNAYLLAFGTLLDNWPCRFGRAHLQSHLKE